MNDIGTLELKLYGLPDGQADLICQFDAPAVLHQVPHAPPPLLAGYGNLQTAFRCRSNQSRQCGKGE